MQQNRDSLYYLSNEQQAQANSVRMAAQQSHRVAQAAMSQRPPLSSVIYPSNIPDPERANQSLGNEAIVPSPQEIADLAYLRCDLRL